MHIDYLWSIYSNEKEAKIGDKKLLVVLHVGAQKCDLQGPLLAICGEFGVILINNGCLLMGVGGVVCSWWLDVPLQYSLNST